MDVKRDSLKTAERWISGLLGVLCLLAVGFLFYGPPTVQPTVQQFPPQCAMPDCLTEVRTVPESEVVVLTVLGALLVVFALNGLRLSSLKVAGVEAQMDSASESVRRALTGKTVPEGPDDELLPKETLPASQPAETIMIDNVVYELYSLQALPIRVMKDVLNKVANVPQGSLARVEFIARRAGRGNHPWLIKFRDQDQTFRISYGGQGKEEATVTEL